MALISHGDRRQHRAGESVRVQGQADGAGSVPSKLQVTWGSGWQPPLVTTGPRSICQAHLLSGSFHLAVELRPGPFDPLLERFHLSRRHLR